MGLVDLLGFPVGKFGGFVVGSSGRRDPFLAGMGSCDPRTHKVGCFLGLQDLGFRGLGVRDAPLHHGVFCISARAAADMRDPRTYRAIRVMFAAGPGEQVPWV